MKYNKLFLTILLVAAASQIKAGNSKVTLKGSLVTCNGFVSHPSLYGSDYNLIKGNSNLNIGLDTLGGSKKEKPRHRPSKKEMSGYLKSNNENYRLYNNTPYKIIDTAGFFIYYLYKNEPALYGKGLIKTDEYFFSTKGDTNIEPFTINNLKKAFPEKHQFHYDMDAIFKSDKDLLQYDNFAHTYKIKFLFLHSVL